MIAFVCFIPMSERYNKAGNPTLKLDFNPAVLFMHVARVKT